MYHGKDRKRFVGHPGASYPGFNSIIGNTHAPNLYRGYGDLRSPFMTQTHGNDGVRHMRRTYSYRSSFPIPPKIKNDI